MLEQFMALPIDRAKLSLADGAVSQPYFCYPEGAVPIGFEGCILYCFLPGYGDTVFAADPETCGERHVFPLAANFTDFLRLVLACTSANPAEQIQWMTRAQFDAHLAAEQAALDADHRQTLDVLANAFDLTPMEDPYTYVKEVQAAFDDRLVRYSAEYYDVLGLEPPAGVEKPEHKPVEFTFYP